MGRIFLFVLDSFGIGEAPDAAAFGDEGTNTVYSASTASSFRMENLKNLGFFQMDGMKTAPMYEKEQVPLKATIARMREVSKGKDTTIGHWEIAGINTPNPLPTFPEGFPESFLTEFSKAVGRGVLCNKPYSGTQVINDYGDEHMRTGDLIVYTSADSVFQIAAHEDIVPVETLYEYCRIARELLKGPELGVGRVIARPFIGESGNYTRTPRRHDFSLVPPQKNMLDQLKESGKDVIAIGKIQDIFVGKGITEHSYTTGNEDGIRQSLAMMDRDFDGLCFINLVDYDMLYGHRRDIEGYGAALTYFDEAFPSFVSKMREDDIIMLTADHGCDPAFLKTTDHTREYTPFFMYGSKVKSQNLGTRDTFADIAATVLDYFHIKPEFDGKSML